MAHQRQAPRPLLLIHGYSADGSAFKQLRSSLETRGIHPDDIDVCTYISLNNEITIKDLAESLDRALRTHPVLRDETSEFDAIVHSTGMLVLRAWLANTPHAVENNPRLKRLKHLIGLAPATWGSPQAHKGRTWMGALIKGSKQLGPDFLHAGDRVLDGLELGSKFTWDLAHVDLLGSRPYYDNGPGTPYVSVFIGNQGYDGLTSVANDPGTDGTIRWAGCGLNTRKITLDLTRAAQDKSGRPVDRATISRWASSRLDVPVIPVSGRNHATIISQPDEDMINLIVDFLAVGGSGKEAYESWLMRASAFGSNGLPAMLSNPSCRTKGLFGEARRLFEKLIGESGDDTIEGWQQFVVHVRDERGDGVPDYMIEILKQDSSGEWLPFDEMYTDVHAYNADASYRCFHIRLPRGICSEPVPLRARIHASTGTELLAYQGYGSEARQLTASSEPVEIDVTELGREAGSLFYPFTTTLLEIILNREPLPFNRECRLFQFV